MAKNSKSKGNAGSEAWNRGIFKALRTLLHLIAVVHFWYSIHYDFTYVVVPESLSRMGNKFGGKFKYLTVLDAIIQAIYFTVSLLNDFIGTNEVTPKKLPKIRILKDYILASLAFPLAFVVGISFWGIYAIDRELIFPKIFDTFFPSWLNHVMHTNIMVFITLEIFISFRTYPRRSKGLLGLITFLLMYLIWVHIIKHYSGVWVYPILEVLELPQRIVFFIGVLAFSVMLYLCGEFLNNKIWTKELKYISRKSN